MTGFTVDDGVVPDDLVKIEDVHLASIEFREAVADVVEEKAELLVVIGGDNLPAFLRSSSIR